MEVDRRRFLKAAVLIPAASVFMACSGSEENAVQTGEASPVERWETVTIPAEIPKQSIFNISNAEYFQFPHIGLRRLQFYWVEQYPVIAVCTLWEAQSVIKRFEQSQKRVTTLGFQPINDPFFPDINNSETSLLRRVISIKAASGIGAEAMDLASLGIDSSKEQPLVQVKMRPLDGRLYTLVFEEGYVDYNGRSSPTSFLTVKFNFEIPRKQSLTV